MQKKIEVFVVTYNRIEYLKIAIQSILNQTFSNFTLIILDNCSTDETEEYVRSIEDERVNYIRHKSNIGGRDNIAYAFEHCEGDYFAIFHDDDVLHPTLLEEEIAYLDANDECVAISCYSNQIDEYGKYKKRTLESECSLNRYFANQFFADYLNNQHSLTFPATLYRGDFIRENKISINMDVGPCYDVFLYMEIERLGGCIVEIPKVLIDYRIHRSQDSTMHLEKMLLQLMRFLLNSNYYSEKVERDELGRKKYFTWYFKRLIAREVSLFIDYKQAKECLKEMKELLKQPYLPFAMYDGVLKVLDIFIKPSNLLYQLYKQKQKKN